ncbi:hypothetical protein GGG16DRAFT_97659 [Schizophyllum commune]
MALPELAVIFLFVLPATAMPINMRSPTGTACLAVFLALFLVLTFLFIFKLLYRTRRCRPLSDCGSHTVSEKTDWSASTIRPFENSNSHWTDDIQKKGFLVGLFGSPSWETSAKAIEDRARIFCRSFDSRSLRSSRRSTRYGSSIRTNEKYPHDDLEKRRSLGNVFDHRALYTISPKAPSGFAHAVQLPVFPTRPKNPSPVSRSSRMFTLPNLSFPKSTTDPSDAIAHRQRRSRVSWKSWKSGSGSSVSGGASLRLVDAKDVPDLPLPLSPDLDKRQSVATQWSAESKPRYSRYSLTTPRIPMPSAVASPLFSPTPSGVDEFGQRLSAMYISHPYALTPCPKRNSNEPVPTPTPTSLAPHSPQCRSPSIPNHPYSSLDAVVTAQSNIPVAKSRSPPTTPDLSSFPSPPLSVVPTPKLKSALKKRNPSTRSSRRQSPVGPSPLRIVTLPDSESGGRLVNGATADGMPPMDNLYAQSLYAGLPFLSAQPYDGVGLGHPSSSKGYAHSRTSSAATRDDPAALLGIIRELADEASAWDPELFMSTSFRAMLEETSKESIPMDRSAEMDLAMLGVEIIREEDEELQEPDSSGSDQTMGSSGNGQASFWEEGGWSGSSGSPSPIVEVGQAC